MTGTPSLGVLASRSVDAGEHLRHGGPAGQIE
jgi:hypothetical protein